MKTLFSVIRPALAAMTPPHVPVNGARRLRAAVLSILLLSACSPDERADAPSDRPPNIVVVLADDLGWGDLSAYGSLENQTPSLDRIADEGLAFTSFYAASAVCSPSRASLLTGRFPVRAGVYSWIHDSHDMHLRVEELTIAEWLSRAGYDAAHVGKWHLGYDLAEGSGDGPDPGDHGFDHWLATGNNASPSHHNPTNFVRNGVELGEVEGYSSHIVVDEAVAWLEGRQDSDAPFFLNVWFHEPHQRVAAPEELVERHQDTSLPAYYGSVENMDLAVGRLRAHLDRLGLWEETLFVFLSDNGSYMEGSNGELRGRKTQLWEGGIRVPGFVHWAGRIAPGQETDVPAGIVDVFPTLAEAAGLPLPDDRTLDGVSLLPLFDGGDVERTKPLYWYYGPSRPVAAIRDGDWSLIADPELDLPTENMFQEEHIGMMKATELTNFRLFNLRTDPGQTVDLSDREPERLASMRETMVELHREVLDEAYDWRVHGP